MEMLVQCSIKQIEKLLDQFNLIVVNTNMAAKLSCNPIGSRRCVVEKLAISGLGAV